jgi:hypothetical protein
VPRGRRSKQLYDLEGVLTWTIDSTPIDVQPGQPLLLAEKVGAFSPSSPKNVRADPTRRFFGRQ